MTCRPARKYLFALLALFPLYMMWTFDHSLWNPDETRDAGIAREMFVEKDFVVPKLNGEAFLEKPPLYYWSCSAVYAVCGRITAGLTRLPAVLYGLLGALFTFLIGRRLYSDRVGVMGAVFLAAGFQWYKMSHFALMDTSLAALIAGAIYFYLAEAPVLFILFVVLAFFAKGFVAVALVGPVIALDLLMKREFRKMAGLVAGGAVLLALCVAPWVHGLWKEGGVDHLRVFFVDNNFNRFVSDKADHTHPIYYYLGSFLGDFAPWTLLFLAAAARLFRREDRSNQTEGGRFLWRWFLVMFVFLSISKSKRSMYLLPAFPAAALVVAAWFDRVIEKGAANPFEKFVVAATTVILFTLGTAIGVGMLVVTHAYVGAVAVFAVLAAAFAWVRRQFQLANRYNVFLGWFFLTAFALMAGNLAFMGRMEADKTFLPYIDRARAESEGGTLIAFRLSEMERGVFYFYLERRLPDLQDEQALNGYLAAHAGEKVVVMMNKNGLEQLTANPPASTALVYSYRPTDKARSFLLFSNRPAVNPG